MLRRKARDGAWPQWGQKRRSKTDVLALLDHLVGAGKNSFGNVQAESLRRFKIDNEVELYGLLNGDIGRRYSTQNFVGKLRSTRKKVDEVRSVRNQPPASTNSLKPKIVGIFAAVAASIILDLLAFVRGSLYT
jgi:hypothetical protein